MRLGLFLDVDKVLTNEPVNLQLARLLHVDAELVEIERDFASGKISNDEFNDQFIPLFREAGFGRSFMEEHFGDIRLRLSVERLLKRTDPVFLVSSGPSYYVNELAARFGIPEERVLCSVYEFEIGGEELLSRCVAPASPSTKSNFVRHLAKNFDMSVGVGDSPSHDGPFLSHCTIQILFGEFDSAYMSVRDIGPLVSLLDGLSELKTLTGRKTFVPGERPRVFIGSSIEGQEVAQEVSESLADVDAEVWNQGTFRPGRTFIENLTQALDKFDFAVMVITPDDITEKRGQTRPSPRDNVLFELGLFAGRLGFDRTFVIHPAEPLIHFPSDLAGVVRVTYNAGHANPSAAVSTACRKISQELGSRDPAR